MPDTIAIEWAQFDAECSQCHFMERPTLQYAKQHQTKRCSSCGATIDLHTPEAKERQSEAAKAAFKRAFDEANR
ncbi:MAG: hypothetical protein ACYDAE_17060 [Steroidobacteraceae bacterium]|jgi:Fe2+ or Zn2+ uptake regulation protein